MNNLTNSNSGNLILSEREVQILHYLKEGLTQKQIAERLFLSRRRVEDLLSDLRKKTSCKNDNMLISFGYENGYIKPKAA